MNDKFFCFQIVEPWFSDKIYRKGNNDFFLSDFSYSNLWTQVEKSADSFSSFLIIPSDNSTLVNEVKNNPNSDISFITPFSNLEFKPKFLTKRGINGEHSFDGLLIKDTSQVKNQTGTEKPTTEITFKVLSQKRVGRTTEDPDPRCYSHELEIEPLELGIEGLLKISRIVFDFGYGQSFENTPGTLIKTKLYNSNLLEKSVGKTFKMKVKNWRRRKKDNSLYFDDKNDLDLNSFSEVTSQLPKKNDDKNQTIIQILASAEQTIQQALAKHNLKISDLDGKFADWEEQLKKLDSKDKIKEFQQKLEQEIKDKQQKSENNINNGLSLSDKIAIGAGIVLVVLVLVGVVWMRRKKKIKK